MVYGETSTTGTEGQKVFTLEGSDTVTITSTATAVKNVTAEGTANNNTFTYVLSNPDGYQTPTTTYGTLTVTPRPITITGTTIEEAIPYDGAEHSVEAYTYNEGTAETKEGLLPTDTITPALPEGHNDSSGGRCYV